MRLPALVYARGRPGAGGEDGATRLGHPAPPPTSPSRWPCSRSISSHLPGAARVPLTLAVVDDLFAIGSSWSSTPPTSSLLPLLGRLCRSGLRLLVQRRRTWWWCSSRSPCSAWALVHASGGARHRGRGAARLHRAGDGAAAATSAAGLGRDRLRAPAGGRCRPASRCRSAPFFAAGSRRCAAPTWRGADRPDGDRHVAGLVLGKASGSSARPTCSPGSPGPNWTRTSAWADLLGLGAAGRNRLHRLAAPRGCPGSGSEFGGRVKMPWTIAASWPICVNVGGERGGEQDVEPRRGGWNSSGRGGEEPPGGAGSAAGPLAVNAAASCGARQPLGHGPAAPPGTHRPDEDDRRAGRPGGLGRCRRSEAYSLGRHPAHVVILRFRRFRLLPPTVSGDRAAHRGRIGRPGGRRGGTGRQSGQLGRPPPGSARGRRWRRAPRRRT